MADKTIVRDKYVDEGELKVLALVTFNSLHKLAWLVNNTFDWDLEREGELIYEKGRYVIVNEAGETDSESEIFSFPLHTFKDEEGKFEADLICNKGGSRFFLQELKQFDYLLLIHGEFDHLPEKMVDKLKRLAQVQMVMEIPLNKIKDTDLLVSYK